MNALLAALGLPMSGGLRSFLVVMLEKLLAAAFARLESAAHSGALGRDAQLALDQLDHAVAALRRLEPLIAGLEKIHLNPAHPEDPAMRHAEGTGGLS
ncbi:MAG: hypothetical protein KGL46_12060 [Hyphomicrobiales bacterium]|nr:hypothetical protein [Hyphomicrobiales bacterium]